MSEDKEQVEIADDDTRRKCVRCQNIFPKDKRYFVYSGKGSYKKRCLQCDYEVGLEGGLDVRDPKMGMNREEYQRLVREEKKAAKASEKAKAAPKDDKPKPWESWGSAEPQESFTVSSRAASSVPVSPPRETNRVKVFNLDPEIKKAKGSTILIINDYMKLDPKNIVSQRVTGKIKVVDAPEPRPRGIPPPQFSVREDSQDSQPTEGLDDQDPDDDDEGDYEEEELDYHQELLKLCKSYPRLAKDFGVTIDDIQHMSPSQQFQLYTNMSLLRGHARGTHLIKSGIVTLSTVLENTVSSSRFNDRVFLQGYADNVTKSEAIDECISEVCQKYSHEIEEYCEPEYALLFSLFGEAIQTHSRNRERYYKNGSV